MADLEEALATIVPLAILVRVGLSGLLFLRGFTGADDSVTLLLGSWKPIDDYRIQLRRVDTRR